MEYSGSAGNRPASSSDYWEVRCEECREGLSARIDGETEPGAPGALDRHLSGCAACRTWFAAAERLNRGLLLRPAPPVPDLTEAILDRAPAPSAEGWPVRIALGVVAVAQLGLAFAQLLGSGGAHHLDPVELAGHLAHESGAWNLAVGVGLLWATFRPKTASGQLPLLTGFVLVLSGVSAGDLLGGQVTAGRVLTHTLVVLGLALLYAVHRQHRERHSPSPTVVRDGADGVTASTAGAGPVARPRHRPGSRRRASGRHAA
ncbi:zf-HC2 domain-containing protein [Amycolatopsis samaneae]|uniref:Zf-HC2 domain-containing protein n=1 Tax=Amycolatopsis samaneae TaxID=664691 RepID=A0ABW5G7L2_9PSEU